MRKRNDSILKSKLVSAIFGIAACAILLIAFSVMWQRVYMSNGRIELETASQPSTSPTPEITNMPGNVFLPVIVSNNNGTETNPTQEWLKYTNHDFGFSIAYPADYYYRIWTPNKADEQLFSVSFLHTEQTETTHPLAINLYIFTNGNSKNLQHWLDLRQKSYQQNLVSLSTGKASDSFNTKFENIEETTFLGKTAYVYKENFLPFTQVRSKALAFIHDSNVYVIDYDFIGDEHHSKFEPIYNIMLRSFELAR